MSSPQPLMTPAPRITPPAPPKRETMGIVAVVLSALFFVPLAPLVGLVLGIVALATKRNKTLAIVAVCLGAFFTLFVVVEVAIAIPAFERYLRLSKTREVDTSLETLANRVSAMSALEWAALPDSDWTPAARACTLPGHQYAVDSEPWAVAPWSTIQFRRLTPSHYQYRVRREAQGFVVEARGDLTCNGHEQTFARHVAPDGVGPMQRLDGRE